MRTKISNGSLGKDIIVFLTIVQIQLAVLCVYNQILPTHDGKVLIGHLCLIRMVSKQFCLGFKTTPSMALVHLPMFLSCHSPSWAPDFYWHPWYIIFLTGGLHHGSAGAAASMLPASFLLIFQCPAQMSILPGWSLLLFPDIFIVLGLDWTTTTLMFITMLHNVTMWFIAPGMCGGR